MPSAAADARLTERFRADLDRLLAEAGLPAAPAIRPTLGIALSGGPDSVALLLLAAGACPGRVKAVTVDHGLRDAAAREAEEAGRLCASLAVPHETVRIMVEHGASLQALARDARYAAIGRWAEREAVPVVLTAHHADDQAETLLMRLARGAGLAGLAGVRAVREAEGLTLLRPLLGWRKAELEAIVAQAGIVPARDPSNHDPRYDRTAARTLLAGAEWLDPLRIAAAAAHLADAEAALAGITRQTAAGAISAVGEEATLRPTGLREIDRRLVLLLLAERFGRHPDGPAVERGMRAMDRGETVTVSDILWRPADEGWKFRPAPPRRSR